LIIDVSNGVFDVPGQVIYHGGTGTNTLSMINGTANNASTLTVPDSLSLTSGFTKFVKKDRGAFVTFDNVQNTPPNDFSLLFKTVHAAQGLTTTASWSAELQNEGLAVNLPGLGTSLGKALNNVKGGRLFKVNDPEEKQSAEEEPKEFFDTSEILTRLLQTDTGASIFDQVGDTILTPDDLLQQLDDLDDTPN